MKPCLDYKKLFSFFLVGVFLCLPLFFARAETATEIKNQINQKNVEIEQLEAQIESYQKQLGTLGQQKTTLSNTIKQLDLTRQKLNADINITQKKIDQTNLVIQNISSDIGDKEESIENDREAIMLDIRRVAEIENSGMTEILLSNKDFTSIWNDIDSMIVVREKIIEKINHLQNVKVVLEGDRQENVDAKNKLLSLKTDLSDQRKVVEGNKSEKSKLLTQTKSSEANYQKLVADQTAKRIALEAEIRDYESRLEYILDRSKLPSAGVLAWPLDYIFVTQPFGEKTGPHRIYANGHSGTDFRARTPLKTYAMSGGVVAGTGNTDLTCPGASFGQWVLIKYDNGLASTHAHLSLIKVVKGQRVGRGEVIGYTGGTGRVTAPHLHISLYVAEAVNVETLPSKSCPGKILTQPIAATSAYLDPMYYLPPYSI